MLQKIKMVGQGLSTTTMQLRLGGMIEASALELIREGKGVFFVRRK